MLKRVGACVLNDKNQLLLYTVQSTVSQCEEEAAKRWPWWDKLKAMGCRIVQVEITYVPTADEVPPPTLQSSNITSGEG